MTDKPKPRRLSETVVPGKDYAKKVKIDDILKKDVAILAFEETKGSKEFALIDEETGEIIIRDYLNITVELNGEILTFSTGAVPITKVLTGLKQKLDTGEAELPLLATFRKEGRTYVVE